MTPSTRGFLLARPNLTPLSYKRLNLNGEKMIEVSQCQPGKAVQVGDRVLTRGISRDATFAILFASLYTLALHVCVQ